MRLTKALLSLARVTGRFHLWRLTVLLYAVGASPFRRANEGMERLCYALMMCRGDRLARRVLASLIRREADHSAENNLWLAQMAWVIGRPTLAVLIHKRTEQLLPEHRPARTLRGFAKGVLSGEISSSLKTAIEELPLPRGGSRPVILTLASSRFLELLKVWLSQVRQHTSAYPLILALDRKVAAALQDEPDCSTMDLSRWFEFDEAGRLHVLSIKNIWVLRVLALRVLAQRSHDVFSLDVDAILMGDLDEMLATFPATDIVAQMDYSIPVDVARRIGFVLCCGFMVLRASDRVVEFLDDYCKRAVLENDDQFAINHLLAEDGISNKAQNERFTTFNSMGLSWLCPASSLVSREISRGSVVRHFLLKDMTAETVVEKLGLQG
jgi:hypothetical protein